MRTAKKRSLKEMNEENEKNEKNEENEENKNNPSKKMKLDFKNDKNINIDKLKELFSMNTSKFNSRYMVYEHFRNLSLALIRDLILIINTKNNKKKLYQFVEFEFYCLDYGLHQDVFTHCDDLQFTTNGSWYFHRSGNTSIEGFKFLNDEKLMSSPNKLHDKKWINPRPNVTFRGGTFKGLDITFGEKDQHFGGILIRSIRKLQPLNPSFAGGNLKVVYAPSDIIEGPCKCVDQLLNQTGFNKIKDLTDSNNFSLNIFDSNNTPIYVDLAKNYDIQQLSPGKKTQNNNNDDYNQYFYNSPRVGLTLKKEKSLNGKELENFQKIKKDFIMAPYRSIRRDCLTKLKKYKPLIAISMVYNNYYYNKLNGNNNKNYNDNDYKTALLFGPFKQNKLNDAISQCEIGQKEGEKAMNQAEIKWKSTSSELCKVFGAYINL